MIATSLTRLRHRPGGVLVGGDRNHAVAADAADRRLDRGEHVLVRPGSGSTPTFRCRRCRPRSSRRCRCPSSIRRCSARRGRRRSPRADPCAGRTGCSPVRRPRCSCPASASARRPPSWRSSVMPVFAMMIAPASLRFFVSVASYGGTSSSNASAPPVVRMSVVWMLSFSAIGMPCSGPRILPCARSRSRSSASSAPRDSR